jgi:uncharacterized protein YuzE
LATLKRGAPSDVRADYDRDADVLYVTLGQPGRGVTDEGEQNIVLRLGEVNGDPVGATIINYQELGWPRKNHKLAKIMARHLSVSPETVLAAMAEIGL